MCCGALRRWNAGPWAGLQRFLVVILLIIFIVAREFIVIIRIPDRMRNIVRGDGERANHLSGGMRSTWPG